MTIWLQDRLIACIILEGSIVVKLHLNWLL